MRFITSSFLLIIIVVSFGFLYQETVGAVCPRPLAYKLGSLDPRFNLSKEEALSAIAEAGAIWEDALGEDLFDFNNNTDDLVINFVYDERQSQENAEKYLADRLEESENANKTIGLAYAEMKQKYESLLDDYESEQKKFSEAQEQYNQTVAKYNQSGGAPESEYQKLENERQRLEAEATHLNAVSQQLNDYVDKINKLSTEANNLVDKYNNDIEFYNNNFADGREFTQGDYQDGVIHIYTFTNHDELVAVLAHELGHALSLDHVADSKSIMYYLMDDQIDTLTLTPEDEAEFTRVCEDYSWRVWLQESWGKLLLSFYAKTN